MKKKIQLSVCLSIIVLYLVGSPPLFAQSDGKLSVESFIQQATTIGSNEVAMGRLGLKRAQNEKVKTYAEQLVGDHTTINADLSAVAKKKNIKRKTLNYQTRWVVQSIVCKPELIRPWKVPK